MKKSIIYLPFFVLFIIIIIKCASTNEKAVQTNWPGYQPFPEGYGYMDTVVLQKAYNSNDIPAIRKHAWSLFAGIMQPTNDSTGWPLWYTWPNSVGAMQIQQLDRSKGNLSSLIQINKSHLQTSLNVFTSAPIYPIPPAVINAYSKDNVFFSSNTQIIPGKHFMFNGDIFIATESLSLDGYNWITNNRLYDTAVLDSLKKIEKDLQGTPPTYVVTKHMYWPVLANQLSALPVWDSSYFESTYPNYAGYEKWNRMVAVDPTNMRGGDTTSVSYLYGVQDSAGNAMSTISKHGVTIHNINDFYYHKITQADWDSFDVYDKANLNASSYWAYNKPIGVGDYLVTIAMHINTKELPGWALQSVWWTDQPNIGQYAQNRPLLPKAKGPWTHYNMVDAYGIPVSAAQQLPIAMNPYIELVSHPIATNCNNCHIRAGYPSASSTYTNGASYQNFGCQQLLLKLHPNTPCLTSYLRTDFQWIIADYVHPFVLTPKKHTK